MNPADQYVAFKALTDQGLDPTEIAARFGASEGHVRKLLKLAAVSPALIEFYRQDDMTLEQLIAFTLCEDHARQEQVWRELAPNQYPWRIREALTAAFVPVTDRRALYVGEEAYLAAGGAITRDLFEEGSYLDDATLLDRLVREKLAAEAEAVRAEGWQWAQIDLDPDHRTYAGYARVRPVEAPLAEEQRLELQTLAAQYDALAEQHANDSARRAAWKSRREAPVSPARRRVLPIAHRQKRSRSGTNAGRISCRANPNRSGTP
ncbi:MAG: hypothetical protein HC871_02395 [Rhizobiales bacterium]|nr:hypothetical protein [Hyphomicrobiales bacterium]